jgi:cardiolipin synthase C
MKNTIANAVKFRLIGPLIFTALLLSTLIVNFAHARPPFKGEETANKGAEVFEPHDVLILDDDILSTQARIDLMLKAQRTLKAQYFIFGDDTTALAGLKVFADAALRRVDTKLIIDAQFNSIPYDVASYLHSVGVQLKLYHPKKWKKPSWLFRRMHDKGVSADGIEMIRGGRNTESSYFGFSTGRNYVDRDIYVRGPVVAKSDAYFDELFASQEVEAPEFSNTPKEIAAGKAKLETAYIAAAQLKNLRFTKPIDWAEKSYSVKNVEFLHDTVGDKDNGHGIAQRLRDMILDAKGIVLIESPYLCPTPEFYNHLLALKAKKVAVIIVTNSESSTDGIPPQGGYMLHRQKLLDLGVQIYEYKGPSSLHAKSMVIDGKISVIGSYNLDSRSQHLNTEIGVAVEDSLFARLLTQSIVSHLANSWRLTPNGESYSGEEMNKEVGFKKHMLNLIMKQAARIDWIYDQI